MRGLWAALAAIAVAAGCSGDASGPGTSPAGAYEAVDWTIVSATASYDILALGGHLAITLHTDGTTDGEFYIPAGASPEPQEQRVSMVGSWRLEDGVVRFTMEGDTYVRFVDWKPDGRTLSTTFMNGGFTVTTVLRR